MKKELVAHVLSNFRAVDMMVHGVQMSPLAVYNTAAYDEMTEDKGTVLIDMGAEHTDIVIMDQGRVWLRSINIGGNHFTDALAKSFKQQFSKAEQLKKTAATSKYQKQIYQAMRPIFADLVAEIQRSLGAYNSSHRDSRLERIVCMGNPFKLPNLQKYLQQELKLEVTRLENFKKATVEKAAAFSENILSMSAAYGLAIQALGLAAIDTNLLPTEIARAMMWKKKQPWFIGAAALVALGALSAGGQWWMARSDFNSAVNQEAKAKNDAAESTDLALRTEWQGINNTYDLARQQVNEQFELVAARKIWPGILADIFAALPPPNAGAPVIAITDITPEYSSELSKISIEIQGATAAPGGGGPAGLGGGAAAGAAAAAAGAAAAKPGAAVTATDHGFVVTISGYSRDAKYDAQNQYKTVSDFKSRLLARAPAAPPSDTRSYYYEIGNPGGHLIKAAPTVSGVGGGGGYGGGYGGGGVLVSSGSSGGGATGSDKPWGNVKGPYWDLFFSDITGIQATTTASINESGGSMDASYALDLVATRAVKPVAPKAMAGAFTFVLKLKVFVKNDIK
jgi:hypothetical protein